MSKPSLARGTRDFGPEVMARRTYILEAIKSVFKKFGFLPLETPSIENLSVLMGKYGDEGDQLLFKILNSGDFLKKVKPADIEAGAKAVLPKVAEKGLRYDLTVPFARFVAMNRHDLVMPFKRFQVQPVWRADRPQKGRYREFYQCDADVVGTDSLLCEAEIILMLHEVFDALQLNDFTVKMNNRKVLTGIAEAIGADGKESELCVAIDKLDKIGQERVLNELSLKGFHQESLDKLSPFLNSAIVPSIAEMLVQTEVKEKNESYLESGMSQEEIDILNEVYYSETYLQPFNQKVLEELKKLLENSSIGQKGIQELEEVFRKVELLELRNSKVTLDLTLARGLSYYTGAIFEVKAGGVQIGSISGGGRYDNLTGTFGLPDVSGVGISFGVDRIYDVLDELDLFPASTTESTKVLLISFDEESLKACLPLLSQIRKAGISAELYPSNVKLKKQFDYANKKGIPYVMVVGSEEIKLQKYSLKDMESGEQDHHSINEIINKLNG
ncbi:histidine--tRNA ligase [Jiulongibacter sp. NS-SX5]|uniref:histidine--tRNA ligase n=1 Tax=Jiulongibacter sp. NS-SX5 TaxID=3463854 RepID=UPI004057D61C